MCNFCTKKKLIKWKNVRRNTTKTGDGFWKMKSEEDNNYEWEHDWNYYNIIFDTKLLYH